MSVQEYIETCTTPEPELFASITRYTNLHVLNAHMLSGQVQGEMLRMFSRMLRPERVLELGTFTGYSALCLAEGLPDNGRLITIEHNDELEDTIRHNFASSPLGSKIDLLIGDAKDILSNQSLSAEHGLLSFSEHGERSFSDSGLFDLTFIDADKREYCTYYDLVFPLIKPGGFILADNTLWDGHIIDPAYDRDKQTLGLRAFNRLVADDPRVSQVILPVRDGLTIIYKHP